MSDDQEDSEVFSGCLFMSAWTEEYSMPQAAVQYREMRDECLVGTSWIWWLWRALTLRDPVTQRATTRVRSNAQFLFGGHHICLSTFCFLHNISISKFNAIKTSWPKNGLHPRFHQHRSPHTVTNLSDVQLVVRLILHYAEDNAILLPGRIPEYKRDDLQLLPYSVTKREVWELYHDAAIEQDGSTAVWYSIFCRLWKKLTPHIVVIKPISDLCWTCQKNSTLIMRAGPITGLWRRRQR